VSAIAKTIIIAANPTSGRNQGLTQAEQLADLLRQKGFTAEVTTDLDALPHTAGAAYSSGELGGVVAAGGDGTVMAVANRTPQGTPIAVFPLGNENLLARHLGIRPDAAQLAEIVANGETRVFDAASANGALFMLMAGAGFDAEVVRRFHATRRGPISSAGYLRPILQTLWSYPFPKIVADCELPDGGRQELTGTMIVVTNVPRYAEGFQFSPQADATDGLLDVFAIAARGAWEILWLAPWLRFGNVSRARSCSAVRCRSLRLRAEDEQATVPIQLDGDPAGTLPLEITVVPKRLTLLAPR
jgi:diacylglycerol kinase family enzyme